MMLVPVCKKAIATPPDNLQLSLQTIPEPVLKHTQRPLPYDKKEKNKKQYNSRWAYDTEKVLLHDCDTIFGFVSLILQNE